MNDLQFLIFISCILIPLSFWLLSYLNGLEGVVQSFRNIPLWQKIIGLLLLILGFGILILSILSPYQAQDQTQDRTEDVRREVLDYENLHMLKEQAGESQKALMLDTNFYYIKGANSEFIKEFVDFRIKNPELRIVSVWGDGTGDAGWDVGYYFITEPIQKQNK